MAVVIPVCLMKDTKMATSLYSSPQRLDCGNPMCGFARIRCPDCGEERLLMFSCKTRGFCPSCHAKRREEWGEWMREELLLAAEESGEYF